MPGGLFRISEQQLKQPDHQRHGQDGKQRAQDIDRAGMRSIPVIELCHGGDCCTGGGRSPLLQFVFAAQSYSISGASSRENRKNAIRARKTDDSAEPSPKTGMIRPFDTYIHPPARQREKMFIALPAATFSGARTTRPAGMQRRSDWTGWSSPKYCFFLLYGLRCQDRDASHRYGVAGQLGFECSRREPQRIADNP